jgi:hypothetical protein
MVTCERKRAKIATQNDIKSSKEIVVEYSYSYSCFGST